MNPHETMKRIVLLLNCHSCYLVLLQLEIYYAPLAWWSQPIIYTFDILDCLIASNLLLNKGSYQEGRLPIVSTNINIRCWLGYQGNYYPRHRIIHIRLHIVVTMSLEAKLESCDYEVFTLWGPPPLHGEGCGWEFTIILTCFPDLNCICQSKSKPWEGNLVGSWSKGPIGHAKFMLAWWVVSPLNPFLSASALSQSSNK